MILRKTFFVFLFLLLLLAFHFVNNLLWLKFDVNPFGVDTDWHLLESIKFHFSYKAIIQSNIGLLDKMKDLFSTFRTWPTRNWPPLLYFLSSLINQNHFSLYNTRLYINFIFYLCLIVSTYFLGKRCFNKNVGLIASFLVSFYPSIYCFSRQFELDFALTALTSLCLVFLLYSDNFSRSNYSICFGISYGIATLVKLQVIFFILAPLVIIIIRIANDKEKSKLKALLNFFISICLAFSIFSLYFLGKLHTMLDIFYAHAFSLYPFFKGISPPLGMSNVYILSYKNFIFYLIALLNHLSFPLFLLFIIAFTKFLHGRKDLRILFSVILLTPLVIFTFISVKWSRYILPLVPIVAVISAYLVDSIKNIKKRKMLLGAIIAYCVLVFLFTSWKIDYWRLKLLHPMTSCFIERPLAKPPDTSRTNIQRKFIPYIQKRLDNGEDIDILIIEETGKTALSLYLPLQDYIFDRKLEIELNLEKNKIYDAKFIIISRLDLLKKKELLKKYGVLFVFEKLILIKNEESSFI